MCGILGLLQSEPFDGRELSEMNRHLRHRGPDDEGLLVATSDSYTLFGGSDTPAAVFSSEIPYAPRSALDGAWRSNRGGVALGHRRLAIVDLSAHGHQPMSYRDRYWITYNGEIYNHIELRQELGSLGHRFSSHSDTEVILAAYAQWGVKCLEKFNGMWSLAILDQENGALFLARDRFGIKPFYYRQANGRFAFASEIKAFSALKDWSPQVNRRQLMDFLVWGVIDHTPDTMFLGVQQLPAGHYILLDSSVYLYGRSAEAAALEVKPACWYSLPPSNTSAPNEPVEELLAAVEDAVRLRLRADVAVGSCLSGGLDSSAIVCLMSRLLANAGVSGTLKTFTSRSPDPQFDESEYASEVISSSRAEGHFVTPTAENLMEDLDRLIWHQDSPIITGSTIAQWMIFREARKNGVIVMLDGQGADEILCGYRGFFGSYLATLAGNGRYLAWCREALALRRESSFSPLRSLGYTAAYLRPGMVSWLGRFDRRAYSDRKWISPSHQSAFDADPVRALGGRAKGVRDMSIAQIQATNLPMLLHWEDRNSMAFSVEARVPFLDYRVVELCLRMPDSEKLGGGIAKAVLRKSMQGIVPEKVRKRRDKMGFVTSEPFWTTGRLSHLFRKDLEEAVGSLEGIIDPSVVTQFVEVVAGTRPFDHRYWRIIAASRWVRLFSATL
jgi:asparagine synthase (glutamine-hydrolysing)